MEKSALHEAIDGATGKAHYFPNRMHVNWFPVESTALADGGRRTADGRRERRVSTGRLAVDMMEREATSGYPAGQRQTFEVTWQQYEITQRVKVKRIRLYRECPDTTSTRSPGYLRTIIKSHLTQDAMVK